MQRSKQSNLLLSFIRKVKNEKKRMSVLKPLEFQCTTVMSQSMKLSLDIRCADALISHIVRGFNKQEVRLKDEIGMKSMMDAYKFVRGIIYKGNASKCNIILSIK